jgi:uncharacterized protein (UPF0333 family)
MILHIHSGASYLSEKEAKIRAGGFFYMGSSTKTDKKLTNGAILIISKVLKHVMSSAAEAEIGAVFYKCKRRSSPSYNIVRIRAPTTPHTNGNIQYHRHRIQQWHNKTKTHKINGYALLLDKRQSETRTI